MAILDKTAILAADDLSYEDVEVPEWGGMVRVRMLSALERDGLMAEFFDLEKNKVRSNKLPEFRVRLAALTMVDEAGERLFGDKEIAALGKKSSAAIERVAEAAAQLNGLGAEAEEALEKN